MLTHVDEDNRPTMVTISEKAASSRYAKAESMMRLPETVAKLFDGQDIQVKKGPVFATAIIAGTMAVKKCWDLIPFCHPIPIESCKINLVMVAADMLHITCEVKTTYKTGVEMEALTGASVAALTVYDMCKALSHSMIIGETKLVAKTGGKRDVGQ